MCLKSVLNNEGIEHDAADTLRLRTVSDYARATGANMFTTKGSYLCRGSWWLRSPSYNTNYHRYVRYVYLNGKANEDDEYVEFTFDGVVPALTLAQ